MKFNKQKIDEFKNKFKNIKEKVKNSQKEKVPKKYYALLILMLLLGVITLSNNMKEYNKSKQENFNEYELESSDNKEVASDQVEINSYITAESSISTNVSNTKEEAVETISKNKESKYIMPVEGEIIKEHAIEKLVYSKTLGMWKTHPGLDIKAKLGDNVKSASSGVVKSVEQDSFYGNTVKILDNEGYLFVYSNLDNNISIKEGDKVNKGNIIGTIGVSATGELADESHLHFEIIKDDKQIDPQDLIN